MLCGEHRSVIELVPWPRRSRVFQDLVRSAFTAWAGWLHQTGIPRL